MDWENIEKSISKKLSDKDVFSDELKKVEKERKEFVESLTDLGEARAIFQLAAQKTQDMLKEDISSIVSLALQSIPFEDNYKFKVDFVPRRNSTECDLLFVAENGKEIHPLDSAGYGLVDIASFGLRIAYWNLQENARNCIICDEPFRNLDKSKHKYAVQMLNMLSDKLNLQFIISTHEQTIIEGADRVFRTSKIKGVTQISVT